MAAAGTQMSPRSSTGRYVRIVLLNREELQIYIETKAKLGEVFDQVCDHLALRETDYFGLAQLVDGEYHFVDTDLKVQKLLPRGWRPRRHMTGDGSCNHLTLYFRVKYYVDSIMLLRERTTRQQYYLQLKDNLIHYNHLCTDERCFLLAAYALQADHGTFNSDKHTDHYFDPREYFPPWVRWTYVLYAVWHKILTQRYS